MTFQLTSGVLFSLVLAGHVVWLTHGQTCSKSRVSQLGIMLTDHVIFLTSKDSPLDCWNTCKDDFRCQSLNFFINTRLCDVNNRTVEHVPKDAVKVPDTVYFTNPLRGEFLKSTVITLCLAFERKEKKNITLARH